MKKEKIPFEAFLVDVPLDQQEFVQNLHNELIEQGCKIKIETAKSGYVLSYLHPKTNKAMANYVFRKKGMLARIYANNIHTYEDFLEELPDTMLAELEKAAVCKRLADPTKCNSRCPMGYIFTVNEAQHKKCRYNLMFYLSQEHNPYIHKWLVKEATA